jgi:hypothetical protein
MTGLRFRVKGEEAVLVVDTGLAVEEFSDLNGSLGVGGAISVRWYLEGAAVDGDGIVGFNYPGFFNGAHGVEVEVGRHGKPGGVSVVGKPGEAAIIIGDEAAQEAVGGVEVGDVSKAEFSAEAIL